VNKDTKTTDFLATTSLLGPVAGLCDCHLLHIDDRVDYALSLRASGHGRLVRIRLIRASRAGLARFRPLTRAGRKKQKNTLRRGFRRATDNHHAIEQPAARTIFYGRFL
jgi:hypothetical protein